MKPCTGLQALISFCCRMSSETWQDVETGWRPVRQSWQEVLLLAQVVCLVVRAWQHSGNSKSPTPKTHLYFRSVQTTTPADKSLNNNGIYVVRADILKAVFCCSPWTLKRSNQCISLAGVKLASCEVSLWLNWELGKLWYLSVTQIVFCRLFAIRLSVSTPYLYILYIKEGKKCFASFTSFFSIRCCNLS